MTYNIETEADLLKALKECRDGDEINFYPAVGINANHVFDKLVHITGTIRAYTRDFVGVEKHQATFTFTKGVKAEGFVMHGDMPDDPKDYKMDGLQTGIRLDGASYGIFRHCTISNFNYMGLHQFDCQLVNVSKSNIQDCATRKEKYGFGYGIWQGGKGNAWNQVLNVTGCTFSHNRHCIAGSKHVNHIYVSDCDFYGGEFSQHILDRHGENQIGGGNYFIIGNRFHAEDRFAFDLAKTGDDIDMIRIEGNTFARPFGKNGRIGGVSEEQFEVFRNNIYP